MEKKKEQNQAKKAEEKKLSKEELKNTKGGGFSYNMNQYGGMTAGGSATSTGG